MNVELRDHDDHFNIARFDSFDFLIIIITLATIIRREETVFFDKV